MVDSIFKQPVIDLKNIQMYIFCLFLLLTDFFQKPAHDMKKAWKQVNNIIHKDKNKDVIKNRKRGWEWPPSYSKLL